MGYDIDVNLDEIKSPLPPRKINKEVPFDPEESAIPEIPEDRLNPTLEPAATTTSIPTTNDNKPKGLGKWWKIGIIGVSILILGITLALTVFKKEKKEDVTLNYWGLWEDSTIMNGVISDFEAKNPGIKINYKRSQRSDYRTRLAAKLAKTGSGTDDVDIFRFHNTWVPMLREFLQPVPSEVVNTIGLESDFLDVYKSDLKESGKWLSVPIMYDGLALFYNKDLLDAAKIPVPNDWWELREAAIKLTVKDENEKISVAGVGLGLANSNVDHWSDVVGLMMKQNGIDLSRNLATSDKNLEDVLKFYASFSKSSEKVWDESLPNSTNLFAAGKLAFYFGPSWRVFDLENLNKDLRYGITTVPQLPTLGGITSGDDTELTDIHWASYWTEGVNKKSQHQEEAWKFLEYLSSKEVLEKLYTAQSQIRNFGEIYPRKSMTDKLKDNPKVWPFLSVANKASSWYLASETGDDGVNSEMQKYFTDGINGISREGSTTETMAALKSGISQLQQKYSLKK